MLNNIRNFSKTWFAKILLVIIVIPFVFWGMGGVFSGGNTNNIAKINNQSISTQDFMNHLNSSRITLETIKDNLNNNILEEMLGELISKKMIQLEEQDLNLIISDKILKKRIKENENFLDENKDYAILKSIVDLATALEFQILAEGVETKEQLDIVLNSGCSVIQGYYYSKPLNVSAVELKLRDVSALRETYQITG